MRKFFSSAALSVAASLPAQEYPTKPVTMIAPFPPGGLVEIVGRPLGAAMEKTLKQPVVLVNRPGAGGAVGMAAAAKAAPDGYTILMGLSSISIFPVSDLHRLGQGVSGEDELLVLGRVRHAPRRDGDAGEFGRHPALPHSLPGRRSRKVAEK
jgi:hypothetical protein